MSLHVFGIRHHGPGCARALTQALGQLQPDILLIEGPPDANSALAQVAAEGLVPPVALLVHSVEDPKNATFYPFAEFSPEWQALRYAAKTHIPARFIDLPCANQLAVRAAPDEARTSSARTAAEHGEETSERVNAAPDDPLDLLSQAAGYSDHEQWWDVQIEHRRDATGLFEAILEAMSALRESSPEARRRELQREAHMRTSVRKAVKEGFEKVGIVCGAWHAPALLARTSAKEDSELLKSLPKIKVAASWIPWTYSRLSYWSGYGAGVDSPGWYGHVYQHGERAPIVWATLAARLLRQQDLDASAANVIETIRLAEALASLRHLPTPGLAELRDAILAVLCEGEPLRLRLIRERLEIGEELGSVPEDAGSVPIAKDFEQQTRRLRLKLSSAHYDLELDLRKDTDRDKSRLFHRLVVLGIDWARPYQQSRGTGTFKEAWRVAWQPEFAVDLIAASVHGNTVELAASDALTSRAAIADLAQVSASIEVAVVADLPRAIPALLDRLDALAASSSDVRLQLESLGPLSRLVRYGDVRGTRVELLRPVLHAVFERVCVGLLPACIQIDDKAAESMNAAITQAHSAALLLEDSDLRSDWLSALRGLIEQGAVHALVRGRACRLLIEQQVLASEDIERHAGVALSTAEEPSKAARWIEGLVGSEGMLLAYQAELLAALDGWLGSLSDEVFMTQLPLLRRAFSVLNEQDRRSLAARLKTGGPANRSVTRSTLDAERAAIVLPVLAHVLGVRHD